MYAAQAVLITSEDQNDFINLQYKIYSIDGKVMMQTQQLANGKVKVDLELHPSSSCFVEMISSNGVRLIPFMKIQ